MHWIRWVSRISVALGLFVLVIGFVRFYAAEWTGFGSRTLWDWLGFSAPFFLLFGGYFLNRFDKKREELIREQQLQESRSIEADRLERGVIDDYFGYMSDLLSQGLRDSSYGDEIRSVARARTLTALQRVNGDRKGTIVRFLWEARLIGYVNSTEGGSVMVQLHEADLSNVNLEGVNLEGVNLEGADLREANFCEASLERANFGEANLYGSYLRWANLKEANLYGADFEGANLDGAYLEGASFEGANLFMSNLRRAKLKRTNLCGADLRGADLSGAYLNGAYLNGAYLGLANLCDADLRGADLCGADLVLSQLLQTKSLCGIIPPDDIDLADLGDKWSPPKPKNTPEPTP